MLRRLGTASPLRQRIIGANGHGDGSTAHAMRLLRAGEALHILQPLAYLALSMAQRLRASRGGGARSAAGDHWRRRLPWLVALALELAFNDELLLLVLLLMLLLLLTIRLLLHTSRYDVVHAPRVYFLSMLYMHYTL